MELRSIAKRIVQDIAPEEAKIFDLVWHEYDEDPALSMTAVDVFDHGLGAGGLRQTTTWSGIVIMLLASIQGPEAPKGVDIETAARTWLDLQVKEGRITASDTNAPRLEKLPSLVAKALRR